MDRENCKTCTDPSKCQYLIPSKVAQIKSMVLPDDCKKYLESLEILESEETNNNTI